MLKINEAAKMLHVNPNACAFMRKRGFLYRTGMKMVIGCIRWMMSPGFRLFCCTEGWDFPLK